MPVLYFFSSHEAASSAKREPASEDEKNTAATGSGRRSHQSNSMHLPVLSNGVYMPAIALGTGGVGNSSSARAAVEIGLASGFTHIDAAADYGNQEGIGEAIKAVPRKSLFLTTKIPGCGVPTQVRPLPQLPLPLFLNLRFVLLFHPSVQSIFFLP